MIDNLPPLPPGTAYTAFLTQEMLDEAAIALGRHPTAKEVQLLDRILKHEHLRRMKRSKDEIMANLVKVANAS
jgi:hypothetical protein